MREINHQANVNLIKERKALISQVYQKLKIDPDKIFDTKDSMQKAMKIQCCSNHKLRDFLDNKIQLF